MPDSDTLIVDPLEAAMDQVAGRRKASLAISAQAAQATEPEVQARILALSRSTKLPPAIVAANLDLVASKARVQEMDLAGLRQEHPELAQWLSDPAKMGLAQDDLPGLRALDLAFRALRARPQDDATGSLPSGFQFTAGGGVIEALPGGLGNYYSPGDLPAELKQRRMLAGLDAMIADARRQAATDRFGAYGSRFLAGAGRSLQATQQMLGTDTPEGERQLQGMESTADGFLADVVGGAGGLAADLPLMLSGGILARGAAALQRLGRTRAVAARLVGKWGAKAISTGVSVGAAVQPLALREGLSSQDGAGFGLLAWGIETAIPGAFGRSGVERALVPGVSKLVRPGARAFLPIAGRMMTDAGLEGLEESVTEFAHALHEAASGVNPLALEPEQLGRRLAVAGTLGGLAGSVFALPEAAQRHFAAREANIRRSLDESRLLENATRAALGSRTKERSPAELADLLAKIGQGEAGQVFFQTAEWEAHWEERGIDPAQAAAKMGADLASYQAARSSGAQVAVPMSGWLAQAEQEDLALMGKARLRPDGWSQSEIDPEIAQARADLESAAQGVAQAGAAQAEDPAEARVRQDVQAQLEAAGTDPDAAARQALVWSSGMARLAKRSGKADAWELYQRYKLRIQRDAPAVFRDGRKVDTLDALLARVQKGDIPTERQVRGESLVEWLRSKGGISDAGGELATFEPDRTDVRKAGQRSLINPAGMTLDDAREQALEAGFDLAEDSENALLDAIREELGGSPVYRAGAADTSLESIREAAQQVEDLVRQAGLDPATADPKEMRQAIERMQEQMAGGFAQDTGPQLIGKPASALAEVEWPSSPWPATRLDGSKPGEAFAAFEQKVVGKTLTLPTGQSITVRPVDFFRFTCQSPKEGIRKGHVAKATSAAEALEMLRDGKLEPVDIAGYQPGRAAQILVIPDLLGDPDVVVEQPSESGPKPEIIAMKNYGGNLIGFGVTWEPEAGRLGIKSFYMKEKRKMRSARGAIVWAKSTPQDRPGDPGALSTGGEAGTNPAPSNGSNVPPAGDAGKREFFQPAFHGTGNSNVYDRFSYDKVGGAGGEGAQAYGWGLYFAGKKAVAEWYKKRLASPDVPRVLMNGGHRGNLGAVQTAARSVDQTLSKDAFRAKVIEHLDAHDYGEAADDIRSGGITVDPQSYGKLYTVEIPDDGDLLDWDKPLKEQPKKIKVLAERYVQGFPERSTGADLYRDLGELAQTMPEHQGKRRDQAVSDFLRAAGIPGIRYLDGSSRGDGDGSHNYVIFDDSRIVIQSYEQKRGKERGRISVLPDKSLVITLTKAADLSTFLHETGHAWLEILHDLAGQDGATPDLVADLATVRSWLGAEDGKALTTEQHEQFARGFEAYLMEGKAPSSALRRAFASFRGWLVGIYRNLKNLHVELQPEVRGVFDRILASEDEITAAADEFQATPLFGDAEMADRIGMTTDEAKRYLEAMARVREQASDTLRADLMEAEIRTRKAAWREEEAEVRAGIEREVDARPDLVAVRALQSGKPPAGMVIGEDGVIFKLDRADLVRQHGEASLAMLPGPRAKGVAQPNAGRRLYTREGGMSLQAAAVAMGFRSGDQLWEALVNAPDRAGLIEQETAAEMRRRHPDPLVDGSIEMRARSILADELAGEALVAEVSALGRKLGEGVAPSEVLREAALRTVAGMRAVDVRPDAFRQAAGKAAREKFASAARLRDAVPEQQAALERQVFQAAQREIYNLHLMRASQEARQASEDGRAYLRRFDSLEGRQRIGKAGGWEWAVTGPQGDSLAVVETAAQAAVLASQTPGATYARANGYLEQIDAIIDGYELRRTSVKALRRREALQAWIERQVEDGEAVTIDQQVVADLGRRSWQSLTVSEQASVVDAVRNIEKLAQLKNRLLASRLAATMEEARESITKSVVENARRVVPGRIGSSSWEAAGDRVARFFEDHRKDSFLVREMDGFTDGGTTWQAFVAPRAEAANLEAELLAVEAQRRDAALRAWGKRLPASRQAVPGTALRLTNEQAISLALNWGNTEGRQRVVQYLNANGFGEGDMEAVLASLDKADWTLINATWQQLDSHWSAIAALERKTTGIEPERVAAVPIQTRFGWQKGGYYPLKYDPRLSSKSGDLQAMIDAKEALKAAGGSAQTRRGHTKARSAKVEGLALRLDFGVVGQHLAEVVHDLTHREVVRDQARLLRDREIAGTIISHHGRGALDQLVQGAVDAALGDKPAGSAAERVSRAVRRNSGVAVFGFNLTSALLNLTGIAQSATRVRPDYLLGALRRVVVDAAHLESAFAWVDGKSSFIRNRSRTWMREVAEADREVGALGVAKLQAQVGRISYWPMVQVQRIVDMITWIGAFDQQMAAGLKAGKTRAEAEADAIPIADQTVADTQSSGRVVDLARIQRGGEVAKIFTAFYSYMNAAYNLNREAVQQFRGGDASDKLRAMSTVCLAFLLPAAITSVLGAMLRGDKEDKKDSLAGKIGKDQASYGMGLLVGSRELSGALSGYDYGGPAGLRGFSVLSKGVSEAVQFKADKGAAKAGLGVAGLFGLPAIEAQRLVDAVAMANEDGDLAAALRAALFGKPRRN